MADLAVAASLSENVRTGDLVLFNQRCDALASTPLFAAVCAVRKYGISHSGRGAFDHVGVVVRNPRTNVPWLLEGRAHSVRLVPFEEAIMDAPASFSEAILIRLRTERHAGMEAEAQGYVAELQLQPVKRCAHMRKRITPTVAQAWRAAGSDGCTPVQRYGHADDPCFGANLVLGLYSRLGLVSKADAALCWTPLGLRSREFRKRLVAGARFEEEIGIM